MTVKRRVAIIGGGAAGMMAAITAAKENAEVTVFEAGDRVGKKILSTGNGKCNFTHEGVTIDSYYSDTPEFAEIAFTKFDDRDTVSFFENLGMLVKNKNGYFYPYSEQAATVLDVLRFQMQELGVSVVTGCKISHIEKKNRVFRIQADKMREFDSVILACGGMAAPKTGSDGNGYELAKKFGHHIITTAPALVQLRGEGDCFKSIAGVRSEGVVKVFCNDRFLGQDEGEIQFTDYGISGIPVFQISRLVNRSNVKKDKVRVVLDLCPKMSLEQLEKVYAKKRKAYSQGTAEEFYTGFLNKKLMLMFLKLKDIRISDSMSSISFDKGMQVLRLCKKFEVNIIGSNGFDQAQVTAGGIDLKQVKDNMESSLEDGLYFAGEILDVDGKCGGYNLQWAWTSGYIAGASAAGKAW